jgi:hypothetical protein
LSLRLIEFAVHRQAFDRALFWLAQLSESVENGKQAAPALSARWPASTARLWARLADDTRAALSALCARVVRRVIVRPSSAARVSLGPDDIRAVQPANALIDLQADSPSDSPFLLATLAARFVGDIQAALPDALASEELEQSSAGKVRVVAATVMLWACT